jgi:uncharacterized protein (DUF488 family)
MSSRLSAHSPRLPIKLALLRDALPLAKPHSTETPVTTIYTIGHSNRSAADFIAMLKAHDIAVLADVRTIPRSRHNPQFGGDALAATLAGESIRYVHMPDLGGLRRPRPDSINAGWRNDSFRGYADYMQTPAFADAVAGLIELGSAAPTAIMCAEAVPWRCHRSLVADALVARGIEAVEIASKTRSTPHKLTSFARVEGERVLYPAEGFQF